MLQLLPDAVLSLIYPQDCSVCDREVASANDGVACSDCWNKTRIFNGNETLCIKCGAFLFGRATSGEPAQCRDVGIIILISVRSRHLRACVEGIGIVTEEDSSIPRRLKTDR